MSRSGYSDDCEHLNLWRSNVERTVAGKRGQKFLRELVAAMEAFPKRRLVSGTLRTEDGEVCALGSVGAKRGLDMTELDPEDPAQIGRAFGISSMLAQEIVYQNDEGSYRPDQSPEQRWERVHGWAISKFKLQEDGHNAV